MTQSPRQEAVELRNKFIPHTRNWDSEHGWTDDEIEAADCAIIAVKEIIQQWEIVDAYLANGQGQLNPNLKYWLEVEIELEKL
jgi:hypothetical protein